MWSILQPLVWVACLVVVAFAGAIVLHHGPDVLHRLSWGAPAFPVIDGEVQYPQIIPPTREAQR
jgi:Na+/proline symporter